MLEPFVVIVSSTLQINKKNYITVRKDNIPKATQQSFYYQIMNTAHYYYSNNLLPPYFAFLSSKQNPSIVKIPYLQLSLFAYFKHYLTICESGYTLFKIVIWQQEYSTYLNSLSEYSIPSSSFKSSDVSASILFTPFLFFLNLFMLVSGFGLIFLFLPLLLFGLRSLFKSAAINSSSVTNLKKSKIR